MQFIVQTSIPAFGMRANTGGSIQQQELDTCMQHHLHSVSVSCRTPHLAGCQLSCHQGAVLLGQQQHLLQEQLVHLQQQQQLRP